MLKVTTSVLIAHSRKRMMSGCVKLSYILLVNMKYLTQAIKLYSNLLWQE